MGQLVPSKSLHTRALWIVLAAGVVAGAAAAKSRATPPAVSLSSAGVGSTTATAANTAGTSTSLAPVSADTQPSPHTGDPLVLREEAPPTMEMVGSAIPQPSVGWPALMALGLLVGGGAFLTASRGQLGNRNKMGPGLEVLDSLRVNGRWQVSLVQAPGRLLVIGASNQEVTLLAELDHELTGAEELTAPQSQSVSEVTPRPVVKPTPTAIQEEDDPFLGDLMSRLAESPSAVLRTTSPADEQAILRERLKALRRGPSQL